MRLAALAIARVVILATEKLDVVVVLVEVEIEVAAALRAFQQAGEYAGCLRDRGLFAACPFLEQVILHEVKRLACFASEYENDFVKAMIERSAKVAENTTLRKQRELDMPFERRYEDNASGKIDDVRFAKMSKRYEQEQSENAKKIKALWLELKKDESKRMDIDDFLETVRR